MHSALGYPTTYEGREKPCCHDATKEPTAPHIANKKVDDLRMRPRNHNINIRAAKNLDYGIVR